MASSPEMHLQKKKKNTRTKGAEKWPEVPNKCFPLITLITNEANTEQDNYAWLSRQDEMSVFSQNSHLI